MDFPKIEVTVYHKIKNKWVGKKMIASFRNVSKLERSNTDVKNTNNVIIRFFYDDNENGFENYISKGDVVVSHAVDDVIQATPITELQKQYGQDEVHKITSITNNSFDTELDHVKVICV